MFQVFGVSHFLQRLYLFAYFFQMSISYQYGDDFPNLILIGDHAYTDPLFSGSSMFSMNVSHFRPGGLWHSFRPGSAAAARQLRHVGRAGIL